MSCIIQSMSDRQFAPWLEQNPTTAITRPALKRVQQMSEAHCGPAVLEMLLSFLNIQVPQSQLSAAIEADAFIQDRGLRVDELATIIKQIRPDLQFWYKNRATVDDLATIVHEYHYPVGVEWQGLFYDTPEDEYEDTGGETWDFGHYSIVRSIDPENDLIVLRDPYGKYAHQDRFFSLKWFESRWWDENEVLIQSYPTTLRDERMMFVVTHKGTPFPKWLDMKTNG